MRHERRRAHAQYLRDGDHDEREIAGQPTAAIASCRDVPPRTDRPGCRASGRSC
jgi:hypothetical protein